LQAFELKKKEDDENYLKFSFESKIDPKSNAVDMLVKKITVNDIIVWHDVQIE